MITRFWGPIDANHFTTIHNIIWNKTNLFTYQNKFYNSFSKQKIGYIKEKIRNEIKKANVKENILNTEDAELLKNFIKKISQEINN